MRAGRFALAVTIVILTVLAGFAQEPSDTVTWTTDDLILWDITLESDSKTIVVFPGEGPATGSGEPCQIVFTVPAKPIPETDPPDSPGFLRLARNFSTHEWRGAEALEDGDYVGMLRVRDGRVVPC